MQAVFEFNDTRFERIVRNTGRVRRIVVHGDTSEFRHAADTVRVAKLAKTIMFLFGKAKTNHPTAGFDRHSDKQWSYWQVCLWSGVKSEPTMKC